ncbi:DNA cytosine methyltransferase [Salinicola peritrichatus]|uniref:DNA cytosine methyltransferase n=1 Tax=Salinicola peritrichatus TaxID=1267424 RepID=UPI000DA1E8CE
MPRAYYNEFDPYAAQWLRNLIEAGHIAPGDVDERDIRDVYPSDLHGYTQCHFFAGIGVWSYALRRAGWPDSRPVWSGSCPCQPFSAAGRRSGMLDERHLWPAFHHLIEQCRPPVVFGEQVASKDGLGWLDLVQADLEGTGYAVGTADLCAAGVGAPHWRQRLWFVADGLADNPNQRQHRRWPSEARDGRNSSRIEPERLRDAGRLGNAHNNGSRWVAGSISRSETETRRKVRSQPDGAEPPGRDGRMADAHDDRQPPRRLPVRPGGQDKAATIESGDRQDVRPGPTNGFWRDADWIFCRDGKWRPVEPGTLPLAHGAPSRVGRLRAYGNAIVAEAAVTFIEAYRDTKLIINEAASGAASSF